MNYSDTLCISSLDFKEVHRFVCNFAEDLRENEKIRVISIPIVIESLLKDNYVRNTFEVTRLDKDNDGTCRTYLELRLRNV